ncbi:MAG: DUF4178 domain-containing protein [Oscillatoriales cyanobacterium SM2_2_1]|nr:DUF4178 domain-containing protein [Oscillatoriales cyanobacterium SM2_2_1]
MLFFGLAIAFALIWQRARPKPLPRGRSRRLNLFNLEIGDFVQHFGVDWAVEGKLTYNDGGDIWLEYMLQDGDRLCWLSVEEDDALEVTLTTTVNDLDVRSDPPDRLTYGDLEYRLVESGTATMTRIGNLRSRPAERCRYYDYEGESYRVLSIEDWGGDIEVSVGQKIPPNSVTLLPGTGQSVYNLPSS